MNCTELREQLPELLYGELSPERAAIMQQHLAECAACRAESAAVQRMRRQLDAAPTPKVHVDLPRLYRAASSAQEARTRHWRRLAYTAGGLAAAVFLAMILRLEIRLDQRQIILAWGQTAAAVPVPERPPRANPPLAAMDGAKLATMENQIHLLDELVHALALDVDTRDQRQRQEIVRLALRLQDWQRQTASQRAATERDLAALYVAQFGPKEKGAKQ